MTGVLPPEWAAMTSLTSFDLGSGHVGGILPKEWGAMTMLTKFYINRNAIKGILPPEWGAWKQMKWFQLTGRHRSMAVTGSIPDSWTQWQENGIKFLAQDLALVGEVSEPVANWLLQHTSECNLVGNSFISASPAVQTHCKFKCCSAGDFRENYAVSRGSQKNRQTQNDDISKCLPCFGDDGTDKVAGYVSDQNAILAGGAHQLNAAELENANEAVGNMCAIGCAPGQFNGITHGSSEAGCHDCPAGQSSGPFASTTCNVCAAGMSSDAGPGIAGAISCVQCTKGRYNSAAGDPFGCKDCPAGTFQNDLQSIVCKSCSTAAGLQRQATLATASTDVADCVCEAGLQFRDGACVDVHQTCDPGHYTHAFANTCKPCTNAGAALLGQFGSNDGKCPVGHFQSHDSSGECACTACPSGQYAMTKGAVGHCSPCKAGSYQAEFGATACDYCPAGTFSDAEGANNADTCKPCTFGHFSAMGAPTCSTCPVPVVGCPNGKFRNTKDISCACTSCSAGKASSSSQATACVNCALGKYAKAGATQCSSCPVGTSQGAVGRSLCPSCNPGMYAATSEAHQCSPCEGGKYQSEGGTTTCKDCPAGKYQNNGAGTYTFCTPCGSRSTPSSCATEAAKPTQQTLGLDLGLILAPVDATSLETRADAVAAVDTLQVQLTTCAATFEEEKAFGATAELAKQVAEEKTAEVPAGSVAIDINGNGKVDISDAVELFVAITMQNFGAARMLDRYRKEQSPGAVTPIETVVANVKAAMAHDQQQ